MLVQHATVSLGPALAGVLAGAGGLRFCYLADVVSFAGALYGVFRLPAMPPLGTLRFNGLAAWLFWLFAHIYFLIGFRNRLMVMVDWAWAYFTYERGARVVAEPASSPLPPPRF